MPPQCELKPCSQVLVPFSCTLAAFSNTRHIMTELIETERLYVEELQSIIEGYFAELDNSELSHLIPPSLENKRDVLFGNMPEIYEFHNRTFLRELENCAEKPELVGTCFLKRKEELQVYEKYCQNKPRSEVLWRQCGDSLFFQECQKKLDHKLSLDAYLLKPVQRITKYQLMLKEMLKCSKGEGTAELEEALATMLDIIKSVNDSMHQIAITGFEGNLSELGKLLMQGSFNVWTDHKKGHSKVKDLARFKPMQRHLFLYDKMLLFCKKREETTDGHEKTPSYSFKHSLKMSSVGITENVKGDSKKFEVWYNGREEVYIIQDVHVLILWSGSGLENGRWYKAFGFPPDTLRGAMAAVKKRQSMASSTAPAAGGISAVPRSTSQPGWGQRRLPSMDTDDFETIPSSAEESSNSSEEEGNNKNVGYIYIISFRIQMR
uniref:Guanine nucleotide exchange factor DBS n=1 Tax=Larimichthys crocea TaxID=215358 RepID=A0A0F8BNU8_LARCR